MRAVAIEQRVERESQPIRGVVARRVDAGIGGGEGGGGGVVERRCGGGGDGVVQGAVVGIRVIVGVGEVRRRHDGDAVVVQVDAVARDAGEGVLRRVGGVEVGEVVGLLVRGARAVGEMEVAARVELERGRAFVRVVGGGHGGALGVGGVGDAEADEARADAGGEVFN